MVSRAVPTANDEPAADDLAEYPDSLDAGLLRIPGVCIPPSVMAILDGTVVSVAQRTLMAVLGIPMLLAPMCGPVLGGWLISAYGWQWIFRINLPVGVILLVLAALIFPRDRPRPSEAFDFVGMLLLSPGLATLLFGISS